MPTTSRQYVVLAAGIYQIGGPYVAGGTRTLVGAGASQTVLKTTNEGPVVRIEPGADISFERLRITEGVFAGTIGSGRGIECPLMPTGPRKFRVIDSDVSNNAGEGVFATACSVELLRSTFNNNYSGASLINGSINVERSVFSMNSVDGLYAGGVGDCFVSNSFMVRNQVGATISVCDNSTRFEFNTIVDNAQGIACYSPASNPKKVAPSNNIIARNQTNIPDTGVGPCLYPGSLIASNVATLNFKSPDAAPYDYHLNVGSVAIDAAAVSGLLVDFDGEQRPQGAARDVGADEAQ